MLIWIESKSEIYYNHSSELGTACVVEISDNKWRWEAHSSNQCQMFDMDCWWGIAKSLEEAQSDAERELLRWPLDTSKDK
jgi:hypothetical protein